MLLFEAREQIAQRVAHYETCDFKDNVKDYGEARKIALKCIDAQMRLSDYRNDMNCFNDEAKFSLSMVEEILEEASFDYEEAKDEL